MAISIKEMTIDQHLRRYHKKWYLKRIDEAKEQARQHFAGWGILAGNTIYVPIQLPMCPTLNKQFPLGAHINYTFTKEDLV